MLSLAPEPPVDPEEESRRNLFADLYRNTEDKIALLFTDDGSYNYPAIKALRRDGASTSASVSALASSNAVTLPPTTDHEPIQEPPAKKAKRAIDEDDYDDDEDEEEEQPPALTKSHTSAIANPLLSPSKSGSSPVQSVNSPSKQGDKPKDAEDKEKTEQDAIKKLEEARLATEQAARRSFHTIMYTLENDRMAMLEQQQLEDSEKQLQAEMDHNPQNGSSANQGSLASANLGASSLTLKHLIARIDMKRDQVRASDADLRVLMNEVRKNRSKWASEENVNQEDLYEALDKVLNELKAHTEYSMPFLSRVNKRDAPDYYNLIKNPMDLGSMTKKLKSLTYKSKVEFVADLNLIWDNCLKYNQDMNHPLRRMANGMRKEAEKLIPLIPDLVIRSRAEVEAEERRKQKEDDDNGEDSDDEPIMSSRGRQTGTKGTAKSRTAPTDAAKEDTPVVDQKPVLQLNGLLAKTGREGSEADGSNGFGTPPIGTMTPGGGNIPSGMASNADAMDIDGSGMNGVNLNQFSVGAEQVYEDEEYKIWKQTTKKDRALAAKERYLLFKDKTLNADSPALLRSKAGMRNFLRHLKEADTLGIGSSEDNLKGNEKQSETLAEGINDETEKVIPDYYDSLSSIPDIPSKLRWIEDGEGQVINQHEEFLRLVPEGHFVAPKSKLTKKIDDNIHQIQETRKLATKLSVIKQMQLQSQVYSNQFPKSNNQSFVEHDIERHFISDDGPVMSGEVCQAALRRTVGKILYHTGFEELQPSAVDTITDVAADYFQKLCHTFSVYCEAEKSSVQTPQGTKLAPRFTPEEVILHTLDESGHDLISLNHYVTEDMDRLSSRLTGLHDRMATHLKDTLRPALAADAGADGVGAFKDGSDQFTSGDFADDLGEDFFGFKALGLDKEMGLDSFAVPFHLLQSRVHSQYQMQNQGTSAVACEVFDPLPPSEPVTVDQVNTHIGLVRNFFMAKLHANNDQALIEDEDLPIKQRKPRPRLGASGKIISAQKRPPREQIAMAKKRKKLEAQAKAAADAAAAGNNANANGKAPAAPVGKKITAVLPPPIPAVASLSMERVDSMQSQSQVTDGGDANGMMSPQSIVE